MDESLGHKHTPRILSLLPQQLRPSRRSLAVVCGISLLLLFAWPRRFWRARDTVWAHRGYVDHDMSPQAPRCVDALRALKKLGVKHMDVDLMLVERPSVDGPAAQVIVGHPLEISGAESNPSACSNILLREFVSDVRAVFRNGDWFASMEPKGAWPSGQGAAAGIALPPPETILKEIADVATEMHFRKSNCGLIVQHQLLQQCSEAVNALVGELSRRFSLITAYKATSGVLEPASLPPPPFSMLMPPLKMLTSSADRQVQASVADFLAAAKRRGLRVVVWAVDTPEEMEAAKAIGVHEFVTNRAAVLMSSRGG